MQTFKEAADMTEKFKCFKIASFTAITTAIIILLSLAVNPAKTNAGISKMDKVVNEINQEQENTIDVVVLGDSEAYSSISPLEIYQDYGITAYVAASPAQTSYQAYEMLQTVLERQKPKVCVMEVNLLFRNYSAAAAVIPKLERMLPIFKYHNMWKEIVDPNYSFDSVISTKQKGYRYNSSVQASKDTDYMKQTDEKAKISTNNVLYVGRIIDLCRQENIELLFIRTPSTKNWSYSKHNGAAEYAEENGIEFIDLNIDNNIEIDWEHDTSDRGDHMNCYGAHKVTAYLGKYLNKNYVLTDHRSDKRYSSWDDALESYKKSINK